MSEFHRDCKSPDGHRGTCKECHRAIIREWKRSNREKVRGYDKKYKESHKKEANEYKKEWHKKNPGKKTEYGRVYRDRHPDKYIAHQAVKYALREGQLIKQPCGCGCVEVEAHHEDYSKPLEVVWICRPCHRKYHRRK